MPHQCFVMRGREGGFAPKRKKREKHLPLSDAVLYVNKHKKSTGPCQARSLFCLSPLLSAAVLQAIS